MSTSRIQRLFESRLATWAAARVPALAIAYENVDFTPPAGAYLACFTLPAETLSDDLAGAHRGYQGIFQINVCVPLQVGKAPASAIADQLAALFPLNLKLTAGGFDVFVRTPLIERAGQPDETHYTLPVDFVYRTDTA